MHITSAFGNDEGKGKISGRAFNASYSGGFATKICLVCNKDSMERWTGEHCGYPVKT